MLVARGGIEPLTRGFSVPRQQILPNSYDVPTLLILLHEFGHVTLWRFCCVSVNFASFEAELHGNYTAYWLVFISTFKLDPSWLKEAITCTLHRRRNRVKCTCRIYIPSLFDTS